MHVCIHTYIHTYTYAESQGVCSWQRLHSTQARRGSISRRKVLCVKRAFALNDGRSTRIHMHIYAHSKIDTDRQRDRQRNTEKHTVRSPQIWIDWARGKIRQLFKSSAEPIDSRMPRFSREGSQERVRAAEDLKICGAAFMDGNRPSCDGVLAQINLKIDAKDQEPDWRPPEDERSASRRLGELSNEVSKTLNRVGCGESRGL